MPHSKVCVSDNLSHYMPLTADDHRLLEELEQNPRTATKDEVLWQSDDVPATLYTLRSGWAYSLHSAGSGNEQILDVFLPGDLLGIRELTFPAYATSLVMLTDGVVCPFPAERLLNIFESSPTLTLAIHASAARQQAIITERLVNILRHDARSRIAHFMLELYYRLKRIDATFTHDFTLPLSQRDMSRLLGMTTVHISRTLTELEREGLLRKTRRNVQILDLDGLARVVSFDPFKITDKLNPLFKGGASGSWTQRNPVSSARPSR
ncbi:Crp/Fnr family transcriptional regulator [Halomonas sp. HP20-15]|uniref:Crp/Fnr family transcriptional regulator n=1 Tax=Halomonas sp. HP20-15 TaxID=3085901 RepID=UPI002981C23B|nr:Crp/Fnr family transcriptional regulator [Halomonas sp. HP20-15]MDW5376595.1 Crp/Fnr family transcriptional regulator [Halomonas sp. HP20-15]